MAGHSHWAGIKRKKEKNDQKRGRLFSKLLSSITVAARNEPDPDFNPRLRTAIEKAKENNVPAEKISLAIDKGSDTSNTLEELLLEAYAPGGVALIVTAITDNKNRTVAEIKTLLNNNNGKWGEEGSVRWAFDQKPNGEWVPKFKQEISEKDREKTLYLKQELENHDDIEQVFINCND